ncbi:MAG: glutamate 5-kinase [Clostridiales bacterium]|nr:glutamate 5-kinase [Clostridiales bacterium]
MRIVIKVGTSTLTHSTGRINIRRVSSLCRVIADLMNAGNEIVLVSSGAIGMGVGKLNLKNRPSDMPTKQACAALGQCELMYVYDEEFSKYNRNIAQILITKADIEIEENHNNFRNTVEKLIEFGVLPVINENDTISTEEIAIGDNDTLAANVSVSTEADLLIVLSDIDGLYDGDPRIDTNARIIEVVEKIDGNIEKMAKGRGTDLGTGGMSTKIHAARIAVGSGIDMVIANGNNPENLYGIIEGENIGTRFLSGGKTK